MATSVPTDPPTLPIESAEGFPHDARCCVCHEPSEDNVTMCGGGHNACRTCADRCVALSQNCPMCRERVMRTDGNGFVRNLGLNNLVADFLWQCPNHKNGCSLKCKAIPMSEHMTTCDFRPAKCTVDGCEWEGMHSQLEAHMTDVDHSRFLVQTVVALNGKLDTFASDIKVIKTAMSAMVTHIKEIKSDMVTSRNAVMNNTISNTQLIKNKLDTAASVHGAIQNQLGGINSVVQTQHRSLQAIEQRQVEAGPTPRIPSARTARRHASAAATAAANKEEIEKLTKQKRDAELQLEDAHKRLKHFDPLFEASTPTHEPSASASVFRRSIDEDEDEDELS